MSSLPRRIVVTGGSGGIGGAIVRRFAGDGALVANLDNRAGPEIAGAVTIATELAEPKSIEAAYRQIDDQFDGLAPDLFVGCAAMSRANHVLDVPAAEIDLLLAVNVRGLFLSAQEAGRRMAKARAGSLIFISSVAAEQAWVSESVYCMTKAATRAMMQGFAIELAPYGVRANAVAPGPIEHHAATMALTRTDPEIYRHEIERTPLARFGAPEEVAEAVALLATSSWINGATLTVDGGFMATGLGLFGAAREKRLAERS